jgi:hypothetical protein
VGRPLSAPTIRHAIRSDLRHSTIGQRLALGGLGAWLAYEWGPGNEGVSAWLLANVLGKVRGPAAMLLVPLVGFAFIFAQQLASGLTALHAFSTFSATADAVWRRLQRDGNDPPGRWAALPFAGKAALAVGLGTTAVALTEVVTSGDAGRARHRGAVVRSAALVATIIGAVALVVSAFAAVGRANERWAPATDRIVEFLGNAWLWIGLAAVSLLIGWLRRRRPAR